MPRSTNRRPPKGVFPDIRRSQLAKVTGLHESTVIRVLLGRQKASSATIAQLAFAMNLTDNQLTSELAKLSEFSGNQLTSGDSGVLDLL